MREGGANGGHQALTRSAGRQQVHGYQSFAHLPIFGEPLIAHHRDMRQLLDSRFDSDDGLLVLECQPPISPDADEHGGSLPYRLERRGQNLRA